MHIRPATPDDYKALCRLDTLAHHDAERPDEIAAWIRNGSCHLAEVNGKALAYGVLTYNFFRAGFLEMLMVGSGFRRQGLGSALTQHFQQTCTQPKLFSSTNMSNHAMQKLLIKAGFQTSGYVDNLDENDPEILFFWSASQLN